MHADRCCFSKFRGARHDENNVFFSARGPQGELSHALREQRDALGHVHDERKMRSDESLKGRTTSVRAPRPLSGPWRLPLAVPRILAGHSLSVVVMDAINSSPPFLFVMAKTSVVLRKDGMKKEDVHHIFLQEFCSKVNAFFYLAREKTRVWLYVIRKGQKFILDVNTPFTSWCSQPVSASRIIDALIKLHRKTLSKEVPKDFLKLLDALSALQAFEMADNGFVTAVLGEKYAEGRKESLKQPGTKRQANANGSPTRKKTVSTAEDQEEAKKEEKYLEVYLKAEKEYLASRALCDAEKPDKVWAENAQDAPKAVNGSLLDLVRGQSEISSVTEGPDVEVKKNKEAEKEKEKKEEVVLQQEEQDEHDFDDNKSPPIAVEEEKKEENEKMPVEENLEPEKEESEDNNLEEEKEEETDDDEDKSTSQAIETVEWRTDVEAVAPCVRGILAINQIFDFDSPSFYPHVARNITEDILKKKNSEIFGALGPLLDESHVNKAERLRYKKFRAYYKNLSKMPDGGFFVNFIHLDYFHLEILENGRRFATYGTGVENDPRIPVVAEVEEVTPDPILNWKDLRIGEITWAYWAKSKQWWPSTIFNFEVVDNQVKIIVRFFTSQTAVIQYGDVERFDDAFHFRYMRTGMPPNYSRDVAFAINTMGCIGYFEEFISPAIANLLEEQGRVIDYVSKYNSLQLKNNARVLKLPNPEHLEIVRSIENAQAAKKTASGGNLAPLLPALSLPKDKNQMKKFEMKRQKDAGSIYEFNCFCNHIVKFDMRREEILESKIFPKGNRFIQLCMKEKETLLSDNLKEIEATEMKKRLNVDAPTFAWCPKNYFNLNDKMPSRRLADNAQPPYSAGSSSRFGRFGSARRRRNDDDDDYDVTY
ncbi:unnamed protein product [Caenorhabditis auriculariae]|uniref:PWWP domain-containing protein n=1 Tax=Caenorhabditis auriculariae TaxID=2777116 RepID=A0A8S1HAH9_9PELO|nr:unnamed protein product [Caenorhabditis auriculariae]